MKLKINNEALAEAFFEDTSLMGIVAPVKGYQLCWRLNQALRFDFRINNDIEIQLTKKNRKYFFSVYDYQVPNTTLVHYIYHNQFDGEYLLPEFRHLDFLWLARGDLFEKAERDMLAESIRAITGVQLVTELTNEKIKNKEHLIF
jgi:hypothetical protein